MNKVAIYGGGGFGKEVRMLLEVVSARFGGTSFAGFIDDFVPRDPVAMKGNYDDIILSVADPNIRESMFKRLDDQGFFFRQLVDPDVYVDKSNSIGIGSIICAGVMMTVHIDIGQFVIVNLGATIGHDVKIGDFTSIMPSVNISGSVTIGRNVFIGSGATILQGLTIGDNAVIGAGAVVIRSVGAGNTVVGVPARSI